MASKAIYSVVAVVGIAAASGAAWWYQRQPASSPASATPARSGQQATPAVEVARVSVTTIADEAQAVGSLRSRQSVIVRPEVSGRVTGLNFRDGARVRRGQVLVQLDEQLPQAQIQQAQAELSIAEANHKRNQELVAQNFVSQRSLDESAANLQVARAKLALARATAARLRIVAPFDGIAGIRNVNLGDYLKDGTDIVNIEDMDAMYVDFRLPERYQTKVRTGQTARVEVDALPGRRYAAVVQAIDPLVDANGRSIAIRGCIDNRHLQLRPGMFARVTAVFGERAGARVVPEEALVPQGGRQYVIRLVDGPDQDTKIAQRVDVQVGLRRPGRVEITQGLQPGDLVVTAGQQRVRSDGMAVRIADVGRGAANGDAPPTAVAGAGASAEAATLVPSPPGRNPCGIPASTQGRGAPPPAAR